jgi:DNA ligase (NAD+)
MNQAGGAGDRVKELVRLLTEAKDAYYNQKQIMSDAAYDALEDELRELAPDHPFLAIVGAPLPAVSEWEKARHTIPMGSLNKAVGEDELRKWAARCDALAAADGLGPISGNLFVTEKLDGLSLEVVYERGGFRDGITRGDGVMGERISANAARMKGVPARLARPESVSMRGEIILRLSDMRAAFPEAMSPRNMAAGTSKRFDGQGCEHLSVIYYDLEGEEFPTQHAKFEHIRALGLPTPPTWVTDVEGAIRLHREYTDKTRHELDYEIDGLVVHANDARALHLLGELGRRPRAAVAYKFPSQAKVSRVQQIWWETGPSGRVSPVAFIEPVKLAGAMVKRASLHNAAMVARLGIGVGDEVLVSRRNDVIPYVEEVVAKHGPPATAPRTCATCGHELQVVGEYLMCRNVACRALVEGRIQNWVGAQGILEWGEKLIEQLVDAKLVKEPADLYRLTVADIAKLERRGELIGKKVIDNLHAALPPPLPVFLAGLGIENFGWQTAKLLVASGLDTLEKLRAATIEQIAAIPTMGQAKAKAVVEGLKDRSAEIDRLLAAGVVPVVPSAGGPLAGKTFCFTGALSRPRKELEQMVENLGATVLSSVTKGLSYLVMADPTSASSKAEKARKYGTKCIGEDELMALVGQAAGANAQ